MDEAPQTNNPNLGLIVLAAGASTRMKSPKQLLKIGHTSMLRHAVETAKATVFRPIVVVLGSNAELFLSEIESCAVSIVVNEDWKSGLSSSLKTGLAELLQRSPDCDATLVVLADQPLITAEQLNEFAMAFEANDVAVIASEYGATVGVPALFSRSSFALFDRLEGDVGAKAIIRQFSDGLLTISLPEAAVDIDTPEDFRKLTGD